MNATKGNIYAILNGIGEAVSFTQVDAKREG